MRFPVYVIVAALGLVLGARSEHEVHAQQIQDLEDLWQVEDGYVLEQQVQKFTLPTSIVFVPSPGPAPDAPLYFVTELRGTVKVVTRDGSTHVFAADFFDQADQTRRGLVPAELGLAGLCLAPEQGYVFVTFAFEKPDRTVGYNIARFETGSSRFALLPAATTLFSEVFSSFAFGFTHHQVGGCQVLEDRLYVGVGDGAIIRASQRLDRVQGKILRLDLDGNPAADNPYVGEDRSEASNYVWALGLRNPFGLKAVDDRLFAADNGLDLDRFVQITKGRNYGWDGSEASVAGIADVVIAPSAGVSQLDYVPPDAVHLPESLRRSFVVAASAFESGKTPGVVAIPYDIGKDEAVSPPRFLARYLGDDPQRVVALAVGPDGLYFAPLIPDADGMSAILRMTYAGTGDGPSRPRTVEGTPYALMLDNGCFHCHSVGRKGETIGPSLEYDDLVPRLRARLVSEAYRVQVEALDSVDAGPLAEFRSARRAVLDAEGDEQLRLWIETFVQHPRFDNAQVLMPELDLTQAEASRIAGFLLRPPENRARKALGRWMIRRTPEPSYRVTAFAFAFGFGVALACFLVLVWVFRRRSTSRSTFRR